jgi:hypothetical protein
MGPVTNRFLQSQLDTLDELIDTLALDNTAEKHADLMDDIEIAKQLQQQARVHYSRDEFQMALALTQRAQQAVLFGRESLDKWKDLMEELGLLMKGPQSR